MKKFSKIAGDKADFMNCMQPVQLHRTSHSEVSCTWFNALVHYFETWTKGPTFLFSTGSCKLCSRSRQGQGQHMKFIVFLCTSNNNKKLQNKILKIAIDSKYINDLGISFINMCEILRYKTLHIKYDLHKRNDT